MLGAPPVSRGAAPRAPACGSRRYSRCARGNSSGRSGTGADNRRIFRGEATTCRPSVSDRDDDKLARGANREHRVLTAGVHRLRASGCIPGALDLFGVLTRPILPARSSWSRLSCRLLDATCDSSTRSYPEAPRSRWGYPDRDRGRRWGLATNSGRSRSTRLDPPRRRGSSRPATMQADVTVKMLRDQAAINSHGA